MVRQDFPFYVEVGLACDTKLYAVYLPQVIVEFLWSLFSSPLQPHQTSIMAVEYDGGVVIGADSRTSSGYVSCSSSLVPRPKIGTWE